MIRKLTLTLLALAFCLSGCGSQVCETTLPPETAPSVTEPSETVPPTTLPPETTVPPTTEPEPVLEAGPGVTADGDVLASGSVIYEDVPYMKLSEFFTGLDDASWFGSENTGYVLNREGRVFEFMPDSPDLILDGRSVSLETPVIVYQDAIWVPVRETCAALGISFLEDGGENHLYCTSVGHGWDWERGVEIPILMYHGVTDDTWGAEELFVSPEDMEAQIVWLLENGYDLITFEDWSHLEDFDKPIMLTYDDGYADNFTDLFPILEKHQAKVTVFLITSSVNKDPRTLNTEQIRQMQESGLVSFQSHTFGHPHLSQCDTQTLHNEMTWSKLHIARITGYEPFVLCYPYGDRSDEARTLAMEHYRFALAMNGGLCTTGDDVSQIPRYYVSRFSSMGEFKSMARGG